MAAFLYDVAIERSGESAFVPWGEQPGWADAYADWLNTADQLTLIPKAGVMGLPVITARLGDGKQWQLFSRVYGRVNSDKQIRLYAIGWRRGDVQSLAWVYPTGAVEVADEPGYVSEFFNE